MKPSTFNFDPDVDITAPATGRAPSGVKWDKTTDAPISGSTPAARHASATGAMAAAPRMSGRAKQLLLWFLEKGRLTLDEARVLLEVPVNCVTGPWNRCDKLGWIVGTGEYFTYTTSRGRTIRREYHRLTDDGQVVALELKRRRGGR